ncbi:MAG: hypothetical protein LBK02_03955 [Treponema sp.]|jgi:predicted Fe-Mo cluster-binding NifX family protein|nr:hypothetical protein [Treponema sp.]
MPYNIAVTSSDGERVDLHFGHAGLFYILEVDEKTGAFTVLDKKEAPRALTDTAEQNAGNCGGCGGSRHENMMARINAIIETIASCAYLLTARIGPKPAELLRRAGISALESPREINEAVAKLNKYHLKYGNINKEK